MILRTAATEPNASHDGPNTYGHPHTRTFFRRGKDPTVNPVLAATVLQLMIIVLWRIKERSTRCEIPQKNYEQNMETSDRVCAPPGISRWLRS
jgi:hypothetical protein